MGLLPVAGELAFFETSRRDFAAMMFYPLIKMTTKKDRRERSPLATRT